MKDANESTISGMQLRMDCFRTAYTLGLMVLASACIGCASLEPVKPWEKGNLAKPAMAFEGDRLELGFAEHTYFSKEGSTGGNGVGGGGCGCN